MNWNPILLGVIDDFYSMNLWILPVISVVGLLLCIYRYKLALIVIPAVSIISAIFLAGFLEHNTYVHIQSLSHNMPYNVATIAVSFILPFIGAFLGWRMSKTKQVGLP